MKRALLLEILLLIIISIPAFLGLLNNSYFSMHDFQHIARLYLLDKGIHQGYFYPRWVDTLGFNFGYPLFNFYPPLVYYIAEFFHLVGFSFIWAIKATIILGFFLSTLGVYYLGKRLSGRLGGIIAAVFYNYFLYHAVLVYVRGALAEFFAMAILPFVFLALLNILNKPSLRNSLLFGLTFALLLLTHPLVSFPFVFYFIAFVVFSIFLKKENRASYVKAILIGTLIGFSLSAFFWLPSLAEKKYTLTDEILTRELANYRIHYVCPQQFVYSAWGYGGSNAGCNDGLTFQLGKPHLIAFVLTIFLAFFYWFKKKRIDAALAYFVFFTGLTLFSLWMATQYSSFLWDNISYLWYLQFPWRFLTFAGLWIALGISYAGLFVLRLIPPNRDFFKKILAFIFTVYLIATIFIVSRYYKPQYLLSQNDAQLTSFSEIAWRVSRSSFEFAPKRVATTTSALDTTVINISRADLPRTPFKIDPDQAVIKVVKNNFNQKIFETDSMVHFTFQLNTFFFPGWKAYLDQEEIVIHNNNAYKLMTIDVPAGKHSLSFVFTNTPVRTIANVISIVGLLFIVAIFFSRRLSDWSF